MGAQLPPMGIWAWARGIGTHIIGPGRTGWTISAAHIAVTATGTVRSSVISARARPASFNQN